MLLQVRPGGKLVLFQIELDIFIGVLIITIECQCLIVKCKGSIMNKIIRLQTALTVLLLGLGSTNLWCMKEEKEGKTFHNTYEGVVITPQNIIDLAPSMNKTLKEVVQSWVSKNKNFLKQLVQTPTPLTHETRKQKTITNTQLIKEHEGIKNLSESNYVLKPTDDDSFLCKGNRWGMRVAHLMYLLGQNCLSEDFDPYKIDCSKMEGIKTYQHISIVAYYLRLLELSKKEKFKYLNFAPTYLVHIPGQPEECCDENYVAIQEYIPTFVEFRELEKSNKELYIKTLNNLPKGLLKELHMSIKYAALWDIAPNLGITESGKYYLVDYELPFNHNPKTFFFQGEEGYKKYLDDVNGGLEGMTKVLEEHASNQAEIWKKIE